MNRLLKQGLGRAEFVLVKKIFRNSESLAATKQRLSFLRQCSRLNVFPKAIANLKLPYDYGIISITEKSKLRTKRFVLNENKRALQKVIAIKQQEQPQLNGRITSQFSPEAASQIQSQRYLAYNTASNLHSKKFLTLLDNLRNNSTSNTSGDNLANQINTASHRNNNGDTSKTHSSKTSNEASQINTASNHNNNDDTSNTHPPKTSNEAKLVTDLTRNLNTQEINPLSKGPKFSLSSGINEHTITSINIAFYRLANQI